MKDLSHLDASWTNVDPCIWSIVENGVGESFRNHRNKFVKCANMAEKESSALVFQPFAHYTLWPSADTTAARMNTAAAASKPDEDQRRPGLGKPAMRPDCPARYQPKARGTILEVKVPRCQSRSRRFACFRLWIRLRDNDVT